MNRMDELKKDCYEAATQQVAAERANNAEKISRSLLRTNGFNSLMNKVGLSSRQKAEKLWQKALNACKNDNLYKDGVNQAKRAKQSALDKIAKLEVDAKRAIQSAQKSMDQLKRQLQEANLDAQTKLLKLTQRTMDAVKEINREKAQKEMEFAKKISTAQQRIALTQQRLMEAKNYLNQKQSYLALKNKHSGGVDAKSGSASEAMQLASSLATAADSAISACNCRKRCTGGEIYGPQRGSSCNAAYDIQKRNYSISGAGCDEPRLIEDPFTSSGGTRSQSSVTPPPSTQRPTARQTSSDTPRRGRSQRERKASRSSR
jgi:hypothetical protein